MELKTYNLNNYKSISQIKNLSNQDLESISVIGSVLPFKTNNYVVNELIDWDKVHDDPIYKLTFPQMGMLSANHYGLMWNTLMATNNRDTIKSVANKIRMQLNPHPAGQMDFNVPHINGKKIEGMQHKYKQTLLFFPSQGQTCHAYCTFCFRWPQFVGMENQKFATKESEELYNYVKINNDVTDILFTGGDPMIMKEKMFANYIEPFLKNKLDNLQTIRIGTKVLSYWPYKFISDGDAEDYLKLFERIVRSGINLSIMAHFSHIRELETEAVKTAISRLRSVGVQIRTQSPILKNINDDAKVWADMWRKQVNLNCIPYYMFIPRDTGAQDYFAVTLENAWKIFREAYQKVSGICRTVRGPSMSCFSGKVQILGVSEIGNQKVFVLRMLQGRNPDWVAKPFFAKYDPKAIWIDDLEPVFSDKFFFEDELKQIMNDRMIEV